MKKKRGEVIVFAFLAGILSLIIGLTWLGMCIVVMTVVSAAIED